MLDEMKIRDLYFGLTEGNEEFKTLNDINNLYFEGISQTQVDELIKGTKRYIYGYKGTGKTTIIKYLSLLCKDKKINNVFISYREIREEADVLSQLKRELQKLNANEDRDSLIFNFWRWYLLTLIAKESNIAIPEKISIYNTTISVFRFIAQTIDYIAKIYRKDDEESFWIENSNPIQLQITNWAEQVSRNIREIEILIRKTTLEKFIIFIDELELSKLRSSYDLDKTMIKQLILAARNINTINSSIHLVIAMRSEVIYDISSAGDEINKQLEDFGVKLNWWEGQFNLTHKLIQMLLKKIRFSMLEFQKRHSNSEETFKVSNSELWARWFPDEIDGVLTWKYLLHLTWARPRDIIRLLNKMREASLDKNKFEKSSYDAAVKEYSLQAWAELKEELSASLDLNQIKNLENILRQVGKNFLFSTFASQCKKVKIMDPENLIEEMYRIGVIGNHFKEGNVSKYRFAYRGDLSVDKNKALEVHRGLWGAIGLSAFDKAILLQNDQDEQDGYFKGEHFRILKK